jgi:hypothetical protein
LGEARIRREPNLGYRGLADLGDLMLCQKGVHEGCRLGRRIVVMKLICSFSRCECDGPTTRKLSKRHLTADRLALRESDCSQMHSKVSSDWLPSYIKTTWPVLEIFKMAGYFPDSPPAVCKPRILKVTDYLLKLIKLYTEVHFGKWPVSFPRSVCWHWLSVCWTDVRSDEPVNLT